MSDDGIWEVGDRFFGLEYFSWMFECAWVLWGDCGYVYIVLNINGLGWEIDNFALWER